MTKNEPTKPTTEAAVAQAAQVAQFSPGPTPPTTAAPKAAGLLHELQYAGKKQKKKRKYSRDLKEFQQVERGLAKANRRVARAIASGIHMRSIHAAGVMARIDVELRRVVIDRIEFR